MSGQNQDFGFGMTSPDAVKNPWMTSQDGYGNYAPNYGYQASPYSLSSQLMYGGYGPQTYASQGIGDSYNTMQNLGSTIGNAFGAVNAANQSQQRFGSVMGLLSQMLGGGGGGGYSAPIHFQDTRSSQRAG